MYLRGMATARVEAPSFRVERRSFVRYSRLRRSPRAVFERTDGRVGRETVSSGGGRLTAGGGGTIPFFGRHALPVQSSQAHGRG